MSNIDQWLGTNNPFSDNVILLDNISLTKVDVVFDDPQVIAANHILLYNNPNAPIGGQNIGDQPHALDGCWADVYGNTYSGDLPPLDPWKSKVLYKLEVEYDIAEGTTYPINNTVTWG